MLVQRVVTALALLGLLLLTVFVLPGWCWPVLVGLFTVAAASEWFALIDAGRFAQMASEPASPSASAHRSAPASSTASQLTERRGRVLVVAGLIGIVFWLRQTGWWPEPLGILLLAATSLWWAVAAPLRLIRGDALAGGWLLATALLLAGWLALTELHERGALVLIGAMGIVWTADVFAYFVGRAIGRRKLAPAISPGKSWEGAIGGAVAVCVLGGLIAVAVAAAGGETTPAAAPGALAAWVLQWRPILPVALFENWGVVATVLVLVALVAMSIVGDLHESLLKRQAGAKDSGTILPGHGGVLDRVDALLPVMPAAALLHRFLA